MSASKALRVGVFVLVVGGLAALAFWRLRPSSPNISADSPAPVVRDSHRDAGRLVTSTRTTLSGSTSIDAQVEALCSACHRFPPPEILPRFIWEKEVSKMYELIGLESSITSYPSQEATLAFFQRSAPVDVTMPPSGAHLSPGPLRVRPVGVRPAGAPPTPAISFVKLVRLNGRTDRSRRPEVLQCDMRHGVVFVQRVGELGRPARVLGRVPNPARVEIVDLDGDGFDDLLVANLGSFVPEDHRRGSVVWLRGRSGGGYEPVALLERVGRVADVRAADIDADGDVDLAVGIFGWRNTGKVVLLDNDGDVDENGVPFFTPLVLDARPGAIHVPIVDLDGDGRLDILALLSQHFETVMAYLNRGPGDFEPQILYEAPHPDWGSAGMDVVDLDGDGDLDVVLVNGDTLDNSVLKPFHGVYWLENKGSYPFTVHALATLAGAYAVRAGDLDGDGDLDIVASAFLPQFTMAASRKPLNLESLLWLEQIEPGRFERHSLEALRCDHPSLEVGDFDGDGDVDVIAGNFTASPEKLGTIDDWITVFENRRR